MTLDLSGFELIADNTESVTLTRKGVSVTVAHALRRTVPKEWTPVGRVEVPAGAVRFHVWTTELSGFEPQLHDQLTTSNGRRYRVYRTELVTKQTRWVLDCLPEVG